MSVREGNFLVPTKAGTPEVTVPFAPFEPDLYPPHPVVSAGDYVVPVQVAGKNVAYPVDMITKEGQPCVAAYGLIDSQDIAFAVTPRIDRVKPAELWRVDPTTGVPVWRWESVDYDDLVVLCAYGTAPRRIWCQARHVETQGLHLILVNESTETIDFSVAMLDLPFPSWYLTAAGSLVRLTLKERVAGQPNNQVRWDVERMAVPGQSNTTYEYSIDFVFGEFWQNVSLFNIVPGERGNSCLIQGNFFSGNETASASFTAVVNNRNHVVWYRIHSYGSWNNYELFDRPAVWGPNKEGHVVVVNPQYVEEEGQQVVQAVGLWSSVNKAGPVVPASSMSSQQLGTEVTESLPSAHFSYQNPYPFGWSAPSLQTWLPGYATRYPAIWTMFLTQDETFTRYNWCRSGDEWEVNYRQGTSELSWIPIVPGYRTAFFPWALGVKGNPLTPNRLIYAADVLPGSEDLVALAVRPKSFNLNGSIDQYKLGLIRIPKVAIIDENTGERTFVTGQFDWVRELFDSETGPFDDQGYEANFVSGLVAHESGSVYVTGQLDF